MSRSGYADDDDGELGLWRGAVQSAINGKRGQSALRELLAELDAMPEKALAAESLVTADGEFCTLGVLGAHRGIELKSIDPEDWDAVAKAFGLATAMVREIVYENDECGRTGEYLPGGKWVCSPETCEERWQRMRKWVDENIKSD